MPANVDWEDEAELTRRFRLEAVGVPERASVEGPSGRDGSGVAEYRAEGVRVRVAFQIMS